MLIDFLECVAFIKTPKAHSVIVIDVFQLVYGRTKTTAPPTVASLNTDE